MFLQKKITSLIVTTFLIFPGMTHSATSGPEFTATQKEVIGKIAGDYLLAHPEILVQVSQKLLEQQQALLTNPDTPATGPAEAKVAVIEFFDYQCVHCHAEQEHAQVLLISAKGGVFTWGRDQKERLPNVPLRDNLGLILQANAALRGFSGVSISLIDGPALGFGSGIALHSSITLATERAEFGFD